MGAHHFDIAQWALDMDDSGPVKIEPPAKGDSGLKFTYANGVEMFHGGPADCVFEGDEGTILVSRGKIETNPEDILKEPIGEKDVPRLSSRPTIAATGSSASSAGRRRSAPPRSAIAPHRLPARQHRLLAAPAAEVGPERREVRRR